MNINTAFAPFQGQLLTQAILLSILKGYSQPTVSSMTTQASCQFDTPVNRYAYYHLPLPYYTYGIKHTELWEDQFALVATPEKALSDKIITTPGIILRSRRMAIEYLTENLRIDEDNLAMLNVAAIQEWLPYSTKKNSLRMVIEAIKRL